MPSEDEVRAFIREIDRYTIEIGFSSGYRKGLPLLEAVARLRVAVLLRFPNIDDPLRPVFSRSVDKAREAERRAENKP